MTSAAVDIYGPGLFNSMPPGVSTLSSWLLPLQLRDFHPEDFGPGVSAVTSTFGIGNGKLSHATLDGRLDDMILGGDPLFVVEMVGGAVKNDVATNPDPGRPLGRDTVICRFATRPSLMKAALGATDPGRPSILHTGSLPSVFDKLVSNRRHSGFVRRAVMWSRWLFFPAFFGSASWGVYARPGLFDWVPRELLLSAPKANVTEVLHGLLPPIPSKLSEAFALGALLERVKVTRHSAWRTDREPSDHCVYTLRFIQRPFALCHSYPFVVNSLRLDFDGADLRCSARGTRRGCSAAGPQDHHL